METVGVVGIGGVEVEIGEKVAAAVGEEGQGVVAGDRDGHGSRA